MGFEVVAVQLLMAAVFSMFFMTNLNLIGTDVDALHADVLALRAENKLLLSMLAGGVCPAPWLRTGL